MILFKLLIEYGSVSARKKLKSKILNLVNFLVNNGISGNLALFSKSNSVRLISCPKLLGKASKLVSLRTKDLRFVNEPKESGNKGNR